MDLEFLESLLGIEYATCMDPETLPPDKWQLINEVTPQGKSLLMEAAKVGNAQCVDFLLRCGVDVNASDIEGNRAIDYALKGEREDRPGVVLLLLRRDSLLPGVKESGKQLRFETLVKENEEIEKLFVERERFHEFVKKGDEAAIEDILKNSVQSSGRERYWVKRDGRSALYTAGAETKFNAWALLKHRNFNYAGEKEYEVKRNMEVYKRIQCNQALEKYFTPIPNSHVFKMLSRSRVLGCPGGMDKRLLDIYEKVDEEPMTSLLLQCLQDEANFQVVFDMERSNICCMFAGMSAGVLGLTDYAMDRVYASGGETAKYDYSDVVSNLVHELAHKAMHVLFANGGRPYKKEDEENKEKYKQIVSKTMTAEGFKTFDNILQRVKGYRKQLHSQELIVRVPEIISKYQFKQHGRDGRQILNTQVGDLFEYYEAQVIPEMENYIKINKTVNVVPTDDFLLSLRSKHKHDSVEVVKSINKIAEWCQRVLRVSNLRLAISHLEKEYNHIMCVDWRLYEKNKDFLISQLIRGELFTHMAVVWEENCNADLDSFSEIRENIDSRCKSNVYLVIPKSVNDPKHRFKPVDYTWKDLSLKTTAWVMEKKVVFQGRNVSLRELMQSALGKDNVEDEMDSLLNADELSCLIDEEKLTIGRPLENALEERGRELLRQHPRCFIPRRTRVRPVELDRGTFEWRAKDAFFISNARPSDLEGAGFGKVSEWDEERISDNCRCFLLKGEWDTRNEDDHFETVIKKLKGFPCPGAKEGDKWEFAHFFKYEGGKKYAHLRSCVVHTNQAVIIAGAPGSGKSVIVNKRAKEMKEQSPCQWVEVFELTNHEEQMERWKEDEFTSKERVEDMLFDLIQRRDSDGIKSGKLSLEKKIYNIFTRSCGNMIIYFDGFDEICPKYKTKVTLFLMALKKETNVKFIVTTRVQEFAELERRLDTIAHNLIQFHREEGVKLITSEWNASLQSLSLEEGREKAKSIISCLQLNHNTNAKLEITEVVQNLKMLYVENANEVIKDIDLNSLAEALMDVGKSALKGEGDLSETPLHSWMLAFVAFEDNLNIKESLRYSQLYERFVGIKVSLYSREKAKASQCEAADASVASIKSLAYLHLKNYSAFLFLGNEEYKMKERDIREMVRIGLLHQREQSTVFIHRTFGEYFLSLWLLEKARKKKVTRVWMSRILLEREFEKVRQFLDSALLSHYGRGSQGGEGEQGMELEVSPLSQSALREGEQFVQSMQKFASKSILECNGGILRYLAENSKESVVDVIFLEADWRVNGLDVEKACTDFRIFDDRKMTWNVNCWSAFSLCSMCMLGEVWKRNSNVTHSKMDYLKFLVKMLHLLEEHGLIANLNVIMSQCGLEWTGADYVELWEEEGREQFKLLIECLVRNKADLGETLKAIVLGTSGDLLLLNTAIYDFHSFAYILESILEECELREALTENENFVSVWTGVVKECVLCKVENMWRYVEGKLEGVEGGYRRFLRKKDREEMIAFFAAFCNWRDVNVIHYVWGLLMREFDERECKKILLDSCNGMINSFEFNHNAFLEWLASLLENGFVDDEEATRLLLSRNDLKKNYMLNNLTAPSLHRLQELLNTWRLASRDILTAMKGHYIQMADSCLLFHCEPFPWDADFVSSVESEWQEVSPSLDIPPLSWPRGIDSDGEWSLLPQVRNYDQWEGKGGRILPVQLKSFVVVLERMLSLEERILGREELLERIKVEWVLIQGTFPRLRILGSGGEWEEGSTRSLPIPFFFAALSKFLSKGQLAEILLQHHSLFGTAFHSALSESDPMAFLAYYDVARWCMDEDALWRVHAIGRGGDEEGRTLLELLMESQEEGIFKCTNVSVKFEEREIDEPRGNESSSCGDKGSKDEAQEPEVGSESEVPVEVEGKEIDEPGGNEFSSCSDEGSEDEAEEPVESSESEVRDIINRD